MSICSSARRRPQAPPAAAEGRHRRPRVGAAFALVAAAVTAWAGLAAAGEIATDGTLGPATRLSETRRGFAIDHRLGRIARDAGGRGVTLFHSFETFSPDKAATQFSAPGSVGRVVARVTGGAPSRIAGLVFATDGLESLAPKPVDLWMLNPAGFALGPGTQFDLRGGDLALSAGDSLRFRDGTVFDTGSARPALTIAPPEAFGFLGAQPGRIVADLMVEGTAPGDRENAIGGGGGDVLMAAERFSLRSGRIRTEDGGRIGLVTVDRGAVVPVDPGAGAWQAPGGAMTIAGPERSPGMVGDGLFGAEIVGLGGGNVVLSSDRLTISAARVRTEAVEGRSGAVDVRAGRFALGDGGQIATIGAGTAGADAGPIRVATGRLSLSGGGALTSRAVSGGDAGAISVDSGDGAIRIAGASSGIVSVIPVEALGEGDAGAVRVSAGTLTVRDTGRILSVLRGSGGSSGRVRIEAGRIDLRSGGQIASGLPSGLSDRAGATGTANTVVVRARERLEITGEGGRNAAGDRPEPSGLFTSTESATGGVGARAGDITVRAPLIRIAERGEVSAESFNAADGGGITIRGFDWLEVDRAGEISTVSQGGRAGDITIRSPGRVRVSDRGLVSSRGLRGAAGGNVSLDVGGLEVSGGGGLLVSARSGDGGALSASARDLLRVRGGDLTAAVASSDGTGGNVTLGGGFVLVDGASRLTATAVEGDGGRLRLAGRGNFVDTAAVLDVRSRSGMDGAIDIEGAFQDFLSPAVPDVSVEDPRRILLDPCAPASERGAGSGRLVVAGGGGSRVSATGTPGLFLGSVPAPSAEGSAAARPLADPSLSFTGCGGTRER